MCLCAIKETLIHYYYLNIRVGVILHVIYGLQWKMYTQYCNIQMYNNIYYATRTYTILCRYYILCMRALAESIFNCFIFSENTIINRHRTAPIICCNVNKKRTFIYLNRDEGISVYRSFFFLPRIKASSCRS